jgi:hypothetical protein
MDLSKQELYKLAFQNTPKDGTVILLFYKNRKLQ